MLPQYPVMFFFMILLKYVVFKLLFAEMVEAETVTEESSWQDILYYLRAKKVERADGKKERAGGCTL